MNYDELREALLSAVETRAYGAAPDVMISMFERAVGEKVAQAIEADPILCKINIQKWAAEIAREVTGGAS